MTTEPVYEPACGAPLCPAPTDPDWHACLVCGKKEIEHAHVEGRGRNPARAKDKSNIVPLCSEHHREVDERQGGTHSHFLRPLPGKGLVYWRTDIHGAVLFECIIDPEAIRIIVPGAEETEHPAQADGASLRRRRQEPPSSEASSDGEQVQMPATSTSGTERLPGSTRTGLAALIAALAPCSEDELATVWDEAQGDAENALLRQCAVATAFHERSPGRGDAWAERAAAFIREQSGRPCSPSQVRDRWNMAIALSQVPDPEEALSVWGSTVTKAVGLVGQMAPDNLAAAIAAAYEARDAGAPMVETAERIEAEFASTDSVRTPPMLVCPACGLIAERSAFKRGSKNETDD